MHQRMQACIAVDWVGQDKLNTNRCSPLAWQRLDPLSNETAQGVSEQANPPEVGLAALFHCVKPLGHGLAIGAL